MLLTPCIVEGSTVIFYAKIFSECTISQPNLVAPIGNTEFMITKQLVWQNRSPLKCLLCNFQLNPLFYRPFERTITMHKDSTGHVGFIFKNGKITSIVKDSSAARNGLLTEHNICEINGQNVIGLKVKNLFFVYLDDAVFILNSKI